MRTVIKLFLLLITIICSMPSKGQTPFSLKGEVLDNGKQLEYFTVVLCSPSDSVILFSGAFQDGYFEFNQLKDSNYIMKISCMGYVPIVKTVNLNKPITDLGSIRVEVDIKMLDDVTIVASRDLFKQEKGQLIINVSNTLLSEAGSLTELLKKSPGIIVDSNNKIQVFGKGTPIVYIDNQQITSNNQLETLQSSDIDKIEIDRNPSAKYSASGHAVIRIKTKRSRTDNLSFTVYDNITQSRRLSNTAGLQMSYKKGGYSNLSSYSITSSNHRDYSNSYEINTLPHYEINNNCDIVRNYSNTIHRFFSGNEYQIKSRHQIGFQFSGLLDNGIEDLTNNQIISKTNHPPIQKQIIQDESESQNLYNANVSYLLNPDSNTLSFILGYAYMKNNSNNSIDEKRLGSQNNILSEINNVNKYNVYSATLDYRINFLDFAEISSGIKYSQVINDGGSYLWDVTAASMIYSQKSNINDRITAAYISADKQIEKLSLSGGVRFEQTSSGTTVDNAVIDTLYRNFFPSLMAEYQLNDNVNLSISYSRRVNRPGFTQINPNMVYFDSLSYSIGNPLLKPVYSDNLELNVAIRDFSFSLGYIGKKDYIVHTAANDESNKDITKWTYFNIDKTKELSLGLVFYKSWRLYTVATELYFNKPFVKVPYLNTTLDRNIPTWYYSLSNNINLKKNLKLNCDFNYQSKGNDGITYWETSYNLSAGLLWKVCKNQLHLSLSANDILKTVNSNSWEDRYGNIITGMQANQDYQYIRFGVKYVLNDIKSNISRKLNNAEELNRL